MKRFLGFCLVLLFALPCRAGDDPFLKKVIKEVQNQYGPLLPKAVAPELTSTLNTVFDRLATAQEELISKYGFSASGFYVVDSPIENAFVFSQKQERVKSIRSYGFVTTGLLRKLFLIDDDQFTSDRREINRAGLSLFAGVMAHELAHPVDDIDEDGIEDSAEGISSQAIEVRTDMEALEILREAQLPEHLLLDALNAILMPRNSRENSLQTFFSSHPEKDLRRALQKIALLLKRMEFGQGSASPLQVDEKILASLHGEIARASRQNSAWTFVVPNDLGSAVDRALQIGKIKMSETYQAIEYNRLVLFIDGELQRRQVANKPLVAKERSALAKLFAAQNVSEDRTRWDQKQPDPKIKIFETVEKEGFLTSATGSQIFARHPSHRFYLNTLDIYLSAEYALPILDEVRKVLSKTQGAYFGRVLNLPTKILIDDVVPLMIDSLKKRTSAWTSTFGGAGQANVTSFAGALDEESALAFFGSYFTEVWSEVGSQAFTPLVTSNPPARAWLIPSFSKNPGALGHPGTRDRVKAKIRSLERQGQVLGEGSRALQLFRAGIANFWKNAGYIALVAMQEPGAVDWPAVFEFLNLSPQEGYRELGRKVRGLIGTPLHRQALMENSVGGSPKSVSPPLWMTNSLRNSLLNSQLELYRRDPSLLQKMNIALMGAMHSERPQPLREKLRNELAKVNLANIQTPEGLVTRFYQTARQLSLDGLDFPQLDLLVEALVGSNLSKEKKGEYVNALLGRPVEIKNLEAFAHCQICKETGFRWGNDSSKAQAIVGAIVPAVFPSVLEFWTKLIENTPGEERARGLEAILRTTDALAPLLLKDLGQDPTGVSSFLRTVHLIEPLNNQKIDETLETLAFGEAGGMTGLRQLQKRLVEILSNLEMSLQQKKNLFLRLSRMSGSAELDIYFEKHLHGKLSVDEEIEVLEQKRIYSEHLQLRLARELIFKKATEGREAARSARRLDLQLLFESVDRMLPHASLAKDDLLEEMAYRLDVRSEAALNMIEDLKSTNWRRLNPRLVNFGGVISEVVGGLEPSARDIFLRYLMDPNHREFPSQIINAFDSSLGKMASDIFGQKFMVVDRDNFIHHYKQRLLLEIIRFIRESTPRERIPFIEMTLTSGPKAFVRKSGWGQKIATEFLAQQIDTNEFKVLMAYLDVVSEREHSVTLSYLLATHFQEKGSVKNLFEIFSTVGVKFGQLISIWKILGEAVATDAKDLKDQARAIPLATLQKFIKPRVAGFKRIIRILGSASLKTVVLVELHSGEQVAVAVRRPYAEDQIRSNMVLARSFLEAAKKRGLPVSSPLYKALLDGIERQLEYEQNFKNEALHMPELKAALVDIERGLRKDFPQWQIGLGEPHPNHPPREDLIVYKLAPGIPMKEIPSGSVLATESGEILVRLKLRLFFKYGLFDSDRHSGNQMVDLDAKTGVKQLTLIDFGQLRSYRKTSFRQSDDRLLFANFVEGIFLSDIPSLVEAGMKMCDGTVADLEGLKARLEKFFAKRNNDMSVVLQEVVEIFSSHSLVFKDEFLTGIFVGFIKIFGEEYVPVPRFKRIFVEEMLKMKMKKIPANLATDLGKLSRSVPGICSELLGKKPKK